MGKDTRSRGRDNDSTKLGLDRVADETLLAVAFLFFMKMTNTKHTPVLSLAQVRTRKQSMRRPELDPHLVLLSPARLQLQAQFAHLRLRKRTCRHALLLDTGDRNLHIIYAFTFRWIRSNCEKIVSFRLEPYWPWYLSAHGTHDPGRWSPCGPCCWLDIPRLQSLPLKVVELRVRVGTLVHELDGA